jgi:hypothetical protein
MNIEMQKRALATREAHLALLDLKKVVDEVTQTTHAAQLEAVHLAIRSRPTEEHPHHCEMFWNFSVRRTSRPR